MEKRENFSKIRGGGVGIRGGIGTLIGIQSTYTRWRGDKRYVATNYVFTDLIEE